MPKTIEQVRCWDGASLPIGLQARLRRELEHMTLLTKQICQLEATQRTALREHRDLMMQRVDKLQHLRGVGLTSAWVFVLEAFGWRQFQHARQIGAMSGLAPTPYQSGSRHSEQGIGKNGNRRWRTMAIEIAWSWLRHQPASDLSLWYQRRFAAGGPRARRIGVVALARKLLIALWRYLEHDIVPGGARLKSVARAA